MEFTIEPQGPFSLSAAQRFLGGFTPGRGSFAEAASTLLLSFPVDGFRGSAAVAVRQQKGRIDGEAEIRGGATLEAVRAQVARTFSLDHDGTDYPAVGDQDPVIGRIQRELDHLRPVCFYSPYEAAVQAIIGQRISQRQAAAIKTKLATEHGERFELQGEILHAFPQPARLMALEDVAGLSDEKLRRLKGVGQAALDGLLDPARLRGVEPAEALESLRTIRGVGDWSAQHILLRGAGLADTLPTADPRSRDAIQQAYGLDDPPSGEDLTRISDGWRPYRMWVVVLLRSWVSTLGRTSSRQ